MASFELQDELQGLPELDGYRIEHDHDFSTEDPEALLEGEYQRLSVNMILPLIRVRQLLWKLLQNQAMRYMTPRCLMSTEAC